MRKLSLEQYLDNLRERQRSAQRNKRAGMPRVGIFWFLPINGRFQLLGDGTFVTEAEDYADCKTHGRDHLTMWEALRSYIGHPDDEYDDWPRGRVVFNKRTGRFVIYADFQLLKHPYKRAMLSYFHLPPAKTLFKTDLHYARSRKLPR